MKLIIGNTGLVGKTILEKEKFDYEFNSKNIHQLPDISHGGDELFLSCLPSTKWLINQDIKKDVENLFNIINILKQRDYSKITLISTIDIYLDSPNEVNEDYPINFSKLHYGTNRYLFELLVSDLLKYEDLKIFRLPGLFNRHIKKNVIYDLLNLNNVEKINLNSSYQWYNLDNLSKDIKFYSDKYTNQKVYNLFTEPLETIEIAKLFDFEVGFFGNRFSYNYKTKLTENGYIQSKESVLEEIKKLIYEYHNK
jgi:hypothetical protein